MRLTWRHRRAGEFDWELAAGATLTAAGGLAAGWLALGLPRPRCVFHALTGFPCLTCGGTRSFQSLLGGDLAAAAAWNPLVFVVGAGLGAFWIYALVVVALRLPRLRADPPATISARARWLLALILAANWIYLAVRAV